MMTDPNAHKVWDSEDTNGRGKDFLDYLIEVNLVVLNKRAESLPSSQLTGAKY